MTAFPRSAKHTICGALAVVALCCPFIGANAAEHGLDTQTVRAIEQDVARTIHRMIRAYDLMDYEGVAAEFSETGVWDSPMSLGRLEGPEGIVAGLSTRPETRQVRHFVTNLLVDIEDADSVSAITYLIAGINDSGDHMNDRGLEYPTPVPVAGPLLLGEWHWRLSRVDDDWKIAYKETRAVFIGQTTRAENPDD